MWQAAALAVAAANTARNAANVAHLAGSEIASSALLAAAAIADEAVAVLTHELDENGGDEAPTPGREPGLAEQWLAAAPLPIERPFIVDLSPVPQDAESGPEDPPPPYPSSQVTESVAPSSLVPESVASPSSSASE